LSGINEKWETLKSKLASVKSYLPDWMTGGDKSPGAPQQKGPSGFFAEVVAGGIMYMMTKNVKFLFGFAIISTFITIGMSVAGY
ncbi:type IV conjugative transfer system pilin TraA, partial [Klebsiella pneumoniae]|uniref:type IV conjugative transfer system pilin TraA n=1 Tax=Klebsiella pneumoniae TaxID=573 RepID=UPI003F865101